MYLYIGVARTSAVQRRQNTRAHVSSPLVKDVALRKKTVIPTATVITHSIPTVQHSYPVVALASLTLTELSTVGELTSGYVSMVSTVDMHDQCNLRVTTG